MQDDVDQYNRWLEYKFAHDTEYLSLLTSILHTGCARSDRTGVGTLSLFGPQMRFDLSKGFPLLTTKKVFLRGVIAELLWIISGCTNIAPLVAQNVHIWDEWADDDGDLGPVYGAQWRDWNAGNRGLSGVMLGGRDQLQELVDGIKRDPFGRRHIVTAWNPDDLSRQKLPCCHCFFQCYVNDKRELSLVLHQRSADMFLGVPFNIASYALLTMMLAQVTGNTPGTFIHNLGDAHIYNSHIEAVKTQLGRMPRQSPTMKLDSKVDNLFAFDHTSFTLEGYNPHEAIKAPVAV